ncbi:ATP synthase F0 subunit b [Blattabacterium sp. (Blattella germanica) str. Bge]|uniref:F0F1 ATP synthase subunit B n=1 Tax=Blattabacterium sp. (Blattella germanica) TaxID=624186 RepID=UPI0001BB626B|nr:F0F1 ATP synthase subunit B [Blattabacterium sp. (Blattella germanica)]ACY40565.1 ATP synthase F0 subunit b [Blattabacterium sp. (Blattella germanica) str. Bge]
MDLVTPSVGLIVWHTIIFVILMLFLSKFAWKPILHFIDQREENIRMSVEKADQVKNELKNVENQKNKILKETRMKRDMILKEAIQIREKIKLKAKEESLIEKKKILEETKKSIQIERKAAIHKLKNQIGDISIQIAEKILKKELDQTNKQDKFIKELVDKLY